MGSRRTTQGRRVRSLSLKRAVAPADTESLVPDEDGSELTRNDKVLLPSKTELGKQDGQGPDPATTSLEETATVRAGLQSHEGGGV